MPLLRQYLRLLDHSRLELFVLAEAWAFAAALVTVSYQAVKSALAYRIHSLRYE